MRNLVSIKIAFVRGRKEYAEKDIIIINKDFSR